MSVVTNAVKKIGNAVTGAVHAVAGDSLSGIAKAVKPIIVPAAAVAGAFFAPELLAAGGITAGTTTAAAATAALNGAAVGSVTAGVASNGNVNAELAGGLGGAALGGAGSEISSAAQAAGASSGLATGASTIGKALLAPTVAGAAGSAVSALTGGASGASGTSSLGSLAGNLTGLAAAYYGANNVANSQVNPSQTVLGANGQPIASSTVGSNGTTTNLGAATSTANQTATTGLGTVASEQQSLYDQAGANQGAYVNSVVAPVAAKAGQQLAAQQQSNAIRGLTGSSLADQSLSNTSIQGSQAVSQATAGALQQSLGLQSGLTSQQATTANDQANLGNTQAQQNLSAMKQGQTVAQQQQTNNNAVTAAQSRAVSGASSALGGVVNAGVNALGQWLGPTTSSTGQPQGPQYAGQTGYDANGVWVGNDMQGTTNLITQDLNSGDNAIYDSLASA